MSPDSTPHPSICEAHGWWAVYSMGGDGPTRYRRDRVAVWATIYNAAEDYVGVQPMFPGDTSELEPETDYGADRFVHLWHDGDSYCHCGSDPRDPRTTDDIYWCESCCGEIR